MSRHKHKVAMENADAKLTKRDNILEKMDHVTQSIDRVFEPNYIKTKTVKLVFAAFPLNTIH